MRVTLANIKSLAKSLAPTQRALADYILANADDIPLMSVQELARAAGVSVATISRFARAVGGTGLKDFKLQLNRARRPSVSGIYEAIRPADSDDTIIDKVFLGNIRSLEDTRHLVRRAALCQAATAIRRAHRVVFFGIGSSGHIAADAALRFAQLDMQAEAYADAYQILAHAARLHKGGVAVGLSHSGRSASTVQALELAGRQGATTIGITNYLHSPLHRVSNIFLGTSFPESGVKVAALSSRVAQLCLLDALYLLVARHRKARPGFVETLNRLTDAKLRLR